MNNTFGVHTDIVQDVAMNLGLNCSRLPVEFIAPRFSALGFLVLGYSGPVLIVSPSLPCDITITNLAPATGKWELWDLVTSSHQTAYSGQGST